MLQSEDTLYFKLYIPECLKHRYHFFITPALQKQILLSFCKPRAHREVTVITKETKSYILWFTTYSTNPFFSSAYSYQIARCSLGSMLLFIILTLPAQATNIYNSSSSLSCESVTKQCCLPECNCWRRIQSHLQSSLELWCSLFSNMHTKAVCPDISVLLTKNKRSKLNAASVLRGNK